MKPKIQSTLLRVSDPQSPHYGEYLTAEKVGKIIQPTQESIDTVVNWLQAHEVTDFHITPNNEFVKARVNVAKV